MTLKEYREKTGKTLRELEAEIRLVEPRITYAMISSIETGVVEPSAPIRLWLAKKQIESNEDRLTDAEDIVLRLLTGHFYDDPLSRSDLHAWSGLSDREARKTIEKLRNRGYWILTSDYGGYYLSSDPQAVEVFAKRERARAVTLLRTIDAMLSRVPGQVEMRD